jgi:hypothetical protein
MKWNLNWRHLRFVVVVVVKITNGKQHTGARKYGVLVVLVLERLRLFTEVQGAVSDFEAVMLPWEVMGAIIT